MNKSLIKVLSIAGGVGLVVIVVAYVQSRTPIDLRGLPSTNTATPPAASQPTPSPTPVKQNQTTDPQVKTAIDAAMDIGEERSALIQDDETALINNDEQHVNALGKAYNENSL